MARCWLLKNRRCGCRDSRSSRGIRQTSAVDRFPELYRRAVRQQSREPSPVTLCAALSPTMASLARGVERMPRTASISRSVANGCEIRSREVDVGICVRFWNQPRWDRRRAEASPINSAKGRAESAPLAAANHQIEVAQQFLARRRSRSPIACPRGGPTPGSEDDLGRTRPENRDKVMTRVEDVGSRCRMMTPVALPRMRGATYWRRLAQSSRANEAGTGPPAVKR